MVVRENPPEVEEKGGSAYKAYCCIDVITVLMVVVLTTGVLPANARLSGKPSPDG